MIGNRKSRVTSIFETLVDGVYIIDTNYNVEFMNDVMIKDYGEGLGGKCYEIFYESEDICPWCQARDVFEGKTVRHEYYNKKLDKLYDIIEFPLKDPDGVVSKVSIFRDITEAKKKDMQLRAAEEDYKRLFEHSGAGVYVSSKEGKFLNANQAFLDMLGYDSKEEFLDIDIKEDLYLNPEDRDKFQELIERDGRVVNYEVYFKRKDGSPIPVQLTSHVRYDENGNILGYEGINIDQSHRKEMEKRIREALEFLNNIIQSSPNAIIASDMDGNILLWNRGAEETLGYKAIDVIGKMNIKMIYPEGMAVKVMKMMRGPEYGGVGVLRSYPMVHIRQDGNIMDGNLSGAIIYDDSGNEVASVGLFVDLQERLAMERTLRETQEKLLQSEKLAAMGRLTSQIAHELNNPLYGIMNTLELLKSEVSPQNKRRKLLDMALSETERLTDLLRKMLSFSKPEEEERQSTDINTILDEILILVKKQLQENDIKLVSALSDEIGKVKASKNQLRQVVLNLISNARDAMPEGGTLTFITRSENGKVIIEVTDTGVGINEEDINSIFDAFFTTKDSVKDVGLGLSVCYGFIKDHDGDISVASKVGEGTTFTIILPEYDE